MWCSIQILTNQVSKNRFKILTNESLMQSYIKKRGKFWEQIEFKGQKSVSNVFLGTLTDFRCILYSVRLQK